jgi:hypothetical protein
MWPGSRGRCWPGRRKRCLRLWSLPAVGEGRGERVKWEKRETISRGGGTGEGADDNRFFFFFLIFFLNKNKI